MKMKRIMSVLLALIMLVSCFAVGGYASDGQSAAEAYESIASVLEAVAEENIMAAQEEPAQEEPAQEEPVQEEPVQEEPVQEEPVQEDSAEEENETSQHVYVNPLVADYVTEEDILAEIENRAPVLYSGSEQVCESFEEAGQFLREQIQNRADVVTLVLYFSDFPGYDGNELSNEGLKAMLAEAYEHTGDPLEGDYIRWHVYGYYSSASWSSRMMTLEIDFLYFDTLAQHNATTPAVNNILNELQLDGKNHYQKVCAIYDYMTDTIDYDYSFPQVSHSAYAAAVKHLAVCQGYALLLYRLLLTVGVDCRIIVSEDHAWNIVKLGDSYYNLDATWDAETYQNQWFLKGSSTFVDHPAEAEYLTAAFKAAYPISRTDFNLSTYDPSKDTSAGQPAEPAEDVVALDSAHFPDGTFLSIVKTNFDTDGSNGLSEAEILNATYLDCSQSGIGSIRGVEYLTALEGLDCYENALTEVDLSGNKALVYLDVGTNALTSLDVSGCPDLVALYCYENNISKLDVTGLADLQELGASDNPLKTIDLTKNPELVWLNVSLSYLEKLDVTGNKKLVELYCYSCELTELDLSGKSSLEALDVEGNYLTSLDLSGCPNLVALYCGYNELTELDVSRLYDLMYLYCESNRLTNVDISNNIWLEEFGCDEAVLGGVNLAGTETGYTADLSGVVEDTYVYTWVQGYSEQQEIFDASFDPETGMASFDRYPDYILVLSQINGYGQMRYVQIRITDMNGDIDGNKNVNAADLVYLMRYIIDAQSAIGEAKADLNHDGLVDILDVIQLVRLLAEAAV